jgi:hypothetical protein
MISYLREYSNLRILAGRAIAVRNNSKMSEISVSQIAQIEEIAQILCELVPMLSMW